MRLSYRLTQLLLSLFIIIGIGRVETGDFSFALGQFWFISGALLLILLTLVDQPHFSKDANVFANGATAVVSLFTITEPQRKGLWWLFIIWSIYLVASSFLLMARRSRELRKESAFIQFVSRMNREIGRPDAIFSAFFLWGVFLQFNNAKSGHALNLMLLFWAVFMILNIPGIAKVISGLLERDIKNTNPAGIIVGITSPSLATVRLSLEQPGGLVGKEVSLLSSKGEQVARGVLFEDVVVQGFRQGGVALTCVEKNWPSVCSGDRVELKIMNSAAATPRIVGVVSPGSSIGKLIVEVDPTLPLSAGTVLRVDSSESSTYFQIVAAVIDETQMEAGNAVQKVRVTAGQLGHWNAQKATFELVDWVAPAGSPVFESSEIGPSPICPEGTCLIGTVPNSSFPVHVDISDSVTHNTALIGVTGSGKSYLAFHLIEAYLEAGIKVLILDLTRQHWQFLQQRSPTALKTAADVAGWLSSTSNLAIHQFAAAPAGFPSATADFAQECFKWLEQSSTLQAGVNSPAKLVIVFEEAHSLIPEWNQVAQQADPQQVNRTSRVVLQGRKFGMGTLLITQRTANVTKTILNQCNTIFALRSFDQTGLDFLRNYMGEEYAQSISTLPDRTAILVGKASSSARPIILRVSDFASRWGGEPSLSPAPSSPVAPSPLNPQEHYLRTTQQE